MATHIKPTEIKVDPLVSAKAAGLRYVTDSKPGFARRLKGQSFVYIGLDGKTIRDSGDLSRIKSLAIPPAWTEVWICPRADGHLQAAGRDARGRKQYRYHPLYRAVRDATKFSRMISFGNALPGIRRPIEKDLTPPGLPRHKVLATVVRLLDRTCMRVGNDEYVRENGSFGLTTLRNK